MLSSFISINIFLIVLLLLFIQFKKIGRVQSRFFLALCFIVFLISMIEALALTSGVFGQYPEFAFLAAPFVLLLGPAMYFFTYSVIASDFKIQWKHGWHFLPFVFFIFLLQYNFQRLSPSDQIEVVQTAQNNPPSYVFISTVIIFGMIGVYMFYSFRGIQKYNEKLRHEFSNHDNKAIDWLQEILWSFALILSTSFLANIVRFYAPQFLQISTLINIAIFIYIGSRLLFRFMDYRVPDLQDRTPENRSGLKHDFLKEIADQVNSFMRVEQAFLDADLSLQKLADQLQIKATLISQALNQVEKRNFFDYINKHRIDYTCSLLKAYSSKEKNVTEIMYESGFNSKSSFNTAFKKYTNMTPSAFRKTKINS